MTSHNCSCSLCFEYVEEKDLQAMNQSIQDMLETLLIHIDISTSENSVICLTCHRKLENYYCFKKKCIFTEDTLRPFVTENVKIDLNEVRNQIIKSEEETEKNVCRLCLQYSDDDMTLNEDESQQFQGLLPEINLHLTNFMILCLTCYNTLHKYFMFVTPIFSKQSYGNTSENSQKSLMNVEHSDEKKVLLLTEKMDLEVEGHSSNFFEEKLDISAQQILDIKSEDNVPSLLNTEEDDIKPMLLHEEFNIKCDGDSSEEQCTYSNSHTFDTTFALQPAGISIKDQAFLRDSKKSSGDELSKNTESAKTGTYECMKCNYGSTNKNNLRYHTFYYHKDPSKMYKCDECDYESKLHWNLKKHAFEMHTDTSKIKMYKCDKCDFACKRPFGVKRHVVAMHTDASQITMYKCNYCDYKAKFHKFLKLHVLRRHAHSSKAQTYRCNQCDYESKNSDEFRKHTALRHTDSSETKIHKCANCQFESKWYESFKRHLVSHRADPSEIQTYKCAVCDYQNKFKSNLRRHIRYKHSKIKMFKCDECNYETKWTKNLKRHIINKHTDPSKIQLYDCEECDYRSKCKGTLKSHVLSRHTDSTDLTI